MRTYRLIATAAAMALGVCFTSLRGQDQQGTGQDSANPPEGMEVLARGPIHEAYAEPVDYTPGPTKVVAKEPPRDIEEVPPDEKPAGENVEWIPGYWAWDDDRSDFIWVSGIWRIAPPGKQWVPGNWSQVEGGWQWTPGFWTDIAETN